MRSCAELTAHPIRQDECSTPTARGRSSGFIAGEAPEDVLLYDRPLNPVGLG